MANTDHQGRPAKKAQANADSLIANLEQKTHLQDSIVTLLKKNADTLDVMIKDYRDMVEKLNKKYVDEVKGKAKPWFLHSKGWYGFIIGIVTMGSIGLTVKLVD